MVEAIESEFVPLLIPNNQPGKAAEILKKFNEPSWIYQVIRFLDAKGNDLIPRKDKVWTTSALAARMQAALEKAGKKPPKYLKALGAIGDGTEVKTTAFAMHCFWTGEAKIGSIPGVVSTEAGWYIGREVTLVQYRTDQIDLATLASKAAKFDCANQVFVTEDSEIEAFKQENSRLEIRKLDLDIYRPAKASDQKRQISGTGLAGMNLSSTQAMHVNSLIRVDSKKALTWLSPRQLSTLTASAKQ